MKANLKGLGNVKGLLLAHGEKIGIFVVGACAVMFVYSSLSHEPLPDQYQADRLKSEIEQVRGEVNEFSWTSAGPDDVRVARPLAQGEDLNVQPDQYATSEFGWDRPVVPPTVLRQDPELLPAMDVEVHSGSGVLAFEDKAIEEQRRLQEEQEKQERDQEQQAQRDREKDDTRAQARRGREPSNRETEPVDPEHPKRRPVSSGVVPAGVQLTGSERLDIGYWAIVVAKVPIREQLKSYDNLLANARDHDPQQDIPHYLGYLVERAEVIPGQPLDFKQVSVYDGQRKNNVLSRRVSSAVNGSVLEKVIHDWPRGNMPEVVDNRFFDPDFVLPFPLPPLVGRDWGEEATHSDIPLIEDDEGLYGMQEDDVATSPEAPTNVDDADLWKSGESRTDRSGRRGAGGRANMRGVSGFRGDEDLGRGRGGGRESYATRSGGRGPGSRGSGAVLARDVSFWLLRFIDFSVQPGKKYKYRVKLVLADVNNTNPRAPGRMVDKDALDSTVYARINQEAEEAREMGKKPPIVRYTDWSKPSQTVGIPLAGDVRVAGAKAPSDSLYNTEPQLALMVTSFGIDKDGQAFQVAKEKDSLRRGSVANMSEEAEILVEQGDYIDELKSFDFRTGITVVDIQGGDRLTRDLSAPAWRY